MDFSTTGIRDFRVEGARSSIAFRYAMNVSNKGVRFWLEDRVSKHQWLSYRTLKDEARIFKRRMCRNCGDKVLDNYVNAKNAIPGAEEEHYYNCFKKGLETVDDADEVSPKAASVSIEYKENNLLLRFRLQFLFGETSLVSSYEFDLQKKELDEIQLLRSHVRDLEDELRVQQRRPKCITAKLTSNASVNTNLIWQADDESTNDFPIVFSEDGNFICLESGLYFMVLLLHFLSKYDTQGISLYCGDEVVRNWTRSLKSDLNYVNDDFTATLKLRKGEAYRFINDGQNEIIADRSELTIS